MANRININITSTARSWIRDRKDNDAYKVALIQWIAGSNEDLLFDISEFIFSRDGKRKAGDG